ncbi:hypothetical protein [Maricaulis sp.]|uniref:hypothetical protein n=1 Tax=Maricaulis sp. TaxID=1486257 RepID=UPI002626A87B|nr:hypothetical protein [Maricaulis sp.]
MFQSRRFDPVLQCARRSRTHVRGARSLAGAFTLGAGLLALAACADPAEDPGEGLPETAAENTLEVLVTAAFTGVDGGAGALTFLPDADAPSLGYVVSAPREGGLDIFNLDGELQTRHAGARLTGLAAAPGFELRGESLPLVFGASPDNDSVFGYAIVRDGARVLELPLQTTQGADGVAGLCLLREGPGFVELVVLGTGANAEVWRVRDAGEDVLSVQTLRSFPLPAPARQCDAFDGEIYTASPAGGLTRLSGDGAILAEAQTTATSLTVGEFSGTRLVLATDGNSETVRSFDARSLAARENIDVVDGLSTPGIGRPGAIEVSHADFGFTAYSNGMLAVFDIADQRVKVISRDAFARAVITGENAAAPAEAG